MGSDIIRMYFNATIPPVLMYSGIAFYELLPKYLKEDMDRPRKVCAKIIGSDMNLVVNSELHSERLLSVAQKIQKDTEITSVK